MLLFFRETVNSLILPLNFYALLIRIWTFGSGFFFVRPKVLSLAFCLPIKKYYLLCACAVVKEISVAKLRHYRCNDFPFWFHRHSSASCTSAAQPGVRLLASLQSYFGAGNSNNMAESHHSMDRLGQRAYFHNDFKGGRDHDNVCPSMVRGIDFIRDPRLNKVKYLVTNMM